MSRARDTANQINRVNSSAADATAITVDSSEKIGIGTDAPTGKLTVRSGVGGGEALTVSSSSSGGNYVTHKHYSSGDIAYIGAGGGAAVSAGTSNDYAIRANSGSLIFATGGNNERARLDNDGLKFHGDTAAANALNDYEEGTFTPLAKGTSTNPSSVPTLIGRYTKIGNQVNIYIKFDAVSFAGASGGVYFDGLPFSASGATVHGIGSIMQYNVCTFNDSPCLYVSGSAAYIYHNVSGSTWDNSQHTGSSQVYMNACATYTTNS